MKNICLQSSSEWNELSKKEKQEILDSYRDLQKFAESLVRQNKELEKISSQRLLHELIDRKVLTEIPVGLYKEFELKRKYKDRDKTITYDGVFLLNASEESEVRIIAK